MPRPGTTRLPFAGPFRGISQQPSLRSVPLGEFADARNVVNRFGKVGPRPGYAPVRTNSYLSTPIAVNQDDTLPFYQCLDSDLVAGLMYATAAWDDSRRVRTIDMRSGAVADFNITSYPANCQPWGIAVDRTRSQLYITDKYNKKLYKTPLAGGSGLTLMVDFGALGWTPWAIALDETDGYAYVACGSGGIQRVDVGSNARLQITTESTKSVAVVSSYLIYARGSATPAEWTIRRCSKTGTGTVTIATLPSSGDDCGAVTGGAIDGTTYVFWTYQGAVTASQGVWRTDINGATTPTKMSSLAGGLYYTGLAIDTSKNRLYLSSFATDIGLFRLLALPTKSRVIATCPWQRVLQGVESSEFADDLILLQILDEIAPAVYWALWFPSTDDCVMLAPGQMDHTIQGHAMTSFVFTDRDTGATGPGDDFQASLGRADFAYMGGGLNTAKGGLLVTNGAGAYAFNFVLGDTCQQVAITDGSGGDTFHLTLGNESTTELAWDASAATVKAALEALASVDHVDVTVATTTYTIWFRGAQSGQAVPVMTGTGTGCSVNCSISAAGGTEENARIYFRPANIATPIQAAPTVPSTDKVQIIQIRGTATGGSWTVTWQGITSVALAYNQSALGLETWIRANWPGCSGVTVSRTGTDGNYDYTVTFTGGTVGGKDVPAMTADGYGLTPDGTATVVCDKLLGVFNWRVEFYSSVWGIPGPSDIQDAYLAVNSGKATVSWAVPNNLYFTSGFIDRVRIYRKRWGSYAGGATEPDGIGSDDSWYFVAECDVGTAGGTGTYTDNIADENRTSARASNWSYPPDTLQFCEVFQNRAWFADLSTQQVFFSELPDNETGEVRMEHVLPSSARLIENTRASDHNPTALKRYGNFLLLFTASDGFVINPATLLAGELVVNRIVGARGCASKWTMVETDAESIFGGRLLYADAKGQLYAFNGSFAERIGDSIRSAAAKTVRQTWAKATTANPGLDTWYYASAAFDSENRRIIISTFEDTGANENPPIQFVFDLDTQSWLLWDIEGWGFFTIPRTWGSEDLGRTTVVFSDASANLMELADYRDDNGVPFDWYMGTGRIAVADPVAVKRIRDISFQFDTQSDGDCAIVLEIASGVSSSDKSFGNVATFDPFTVCSWRAVTARIDMRSEDIVITMSGTVSGVAQPNPELVGLAFDYEVLAQRQ